MSIQSMAAHIIMHVVRQKK